MSVESCQTVRKIIEACFTGTHERVTGDIPETHGIYTVLGIADTFERASKLRDVVWTAVAGAGFVVVALPIKSLDPPRSHDMYVLTFRVVMDSCDAIYGPRCNGHRLRC